MNEGIYLIVGLGNPGAEYENTRHNAGFRWVDAICQLHNLRLSENKKFFGHIGRINLEAKQSWLLQPDTYMNASGRAVAALARFYRIAPHHILVVHDELDLQPGTVKLKYGGGNGGHNGLKDISAQIGSNDYWRLRLGIGHPGEKSAVVNYVLRPPVTQEIDLIEYAIDKSVALLPMLLEGNLQAAMLKLHSKPGNHPT